MYNTVFPGKSEYIREYTREYGYLRLDCADGLEDGLRLTSVDDVDTGVRQYRHWRARQQAALVLFASVAADRVHRAGRHGSAGHRRLSSWSWSLDHSFWRDARYAAMYSSL